MFDRWWVCIRSSISCIRIIGFSSRIWLGIGLLMSGCSYRSKGRESTLRSRFSRSRSRTCISGNLLGCNLAYKCWMLSWSTDKDHCRPNNSPKHRKARMGCYRQSYHKHFRSQKCYTPANKHCIWCLRIGSSFWLRRWGWCRWIGIMWERMRLALRALLVRGEEGHCSFYMN